MIVVSDTSPISNLWVVGHLDLLRHLYTSLLVPEAVWEELQAVPPVRGKSLDHIAGGWLERRAVSSRSVAAALRSELDAGEAEAIALAIEASAGLLLVDERKARMVAARLGVRCVELGVLLQAKRAGILPAVKGVLDTLIVQAGFWISVPLYQRVLHPRASILERRTLLAPTTAPDPAPMSPTGPGPSDIACGILSRLFRCPSPFATSGRGRACPLPCARIAGTCGVDRWVRTWG